MKAYVLFSFPPTKAVADQKLLMLQQFKSRGNGRAPQPPRDVQAQAGSRGALITWKLPNATDAQWIRGWRVYRNTETNLQQEIQDPAQRQFYVSLSAGATPPVTNFFVSSISAAGIESVKVHVQAQALAESGAPAVPSIPPGYSAESAGSLNRRYYGQQ